MRSGIPSFDRAAASQHVMFLRQATEAVGRPELATASGGPPSLQITTFPSKGLVAEWTDRKTWLPVAVVIPRVDAPDILERALIAIAYAASGSIGSDGMMPPETAEYAILVGKPLCGDDRRRICISATLQPPALDRHRIGRLAEALAKIIRPVFVEGDGDSLHAVGHIQTVEELAMGRDPPLGIAFRTGIRQRRQAIADGELP